MAYEVKYFGEAPEGFVEPVLDDVTAFHDAVVLRVFDLEPLRPFLEQQLGCKLSKAPLTVVGATTVQDYEILSLAEKGQLVAILGKVVEKKEDVGEQPT